MSSSLARGGQVTEVPEPMPIEPRHAPAAALASWAGPPLVPGRWRDLPQEEALPLMVRLARRIGPDQPLGLQLDSWPVRVRATALPFYPGWLLVQVQFALPDGSIGLADYLYGRPAVLVIGGLSSVAHAVNDLTGLHVDSPDLAAEYVRFFCSSIHGDDGRFAIVEQPDDLFGFGRPGPGAGPAVPVEVLDAIAPITVEPVDGGYEARATVRYGTTMFRSTMHLDPKGLVEMVGDDPLGEVDMEPEVFRAPYWIVAPAPAEGDQEDEPT